MEDILQWVAIGGLLLLLMYRDSKMHARVSEMRQDVQGLGTEFSKSLASVRTVDLTKQAGVVRPPDEAA